MLFSDFVVGFDLLADYTGLFVWAWFGNFGFAFDCLLGCSLWFVCLGLLFDVVLIWFAGDLICFCLLHLLFLCCLSVDCVVCVLFFALVDIYFVVDDVLFASG